MKRTKQSTFAKREQSEPHTGYAPAGGDKAKVWRDVVRDMKCKRLDFEQKLSVTRSSFMQDEYEANIELLNVLITEYDARAAQIEQGE